MNNPKLHHFFAQSLQDRFANSDGALFAYDKRFPQKGIWETTSKNIFAETHLYSITKDGEKDPSLERDVFSPLDRKANDLVEKIVTAARVNKRPILSPNEKKLWNEFLYYQWKRVPDRLRTSAALTDLKNYIPGLISEYEKKNIHVSDEKKKRFEDPKYLKELANSARAIAAATKPSEEIESILERKGIVIALIKKGTKSFIIGSQPVVRFSNSGNMHLSDPGVELWLPVSRDVAISPAYRKGEEVLIEVTDAQVRHINLTIFKQSTTIAARSAYLISSIVNHC
ncbi:DUF4238 domain-containing protein [Ferrovibrio terrae]|uniref:DUF4238 domain-containing protein n=1 Tax=Ferrovibrio terrae TaxID=2594003 RepID=UPI0031379BEA